jgi:hypothetical protein
MATNNAINKVITATPTANAVSTWDANSNLSANNHLNGFTSTASAAGTTILTVSSNQYQLITGATTQTVRLPDATTLVNGTTFIINNQSTGNVTVQNNTPATLVVLGTLRVIKYTLINNSTAAGTWQLGDATLITNQQNFTTATTSTYTPTPGMAYIIVEMCAGGGASGGLPLVNTSGVGSISGCGGAGGYLKFMMTAAQVGASLSYTVGAGGTAGAAGAAGNAGNATTFGTWSCGAGGGGAAGGANAASMITAGGGNSANSVGTGTVIFNIRPVSNQSMFFTAGTNFIVMPSHGAGGPLSFNGNLTTYYAINTTSIGFSVNGLTTLPGWGYGGYSIAQFTGSFGAAAGIGGRLGAIFVTEYIYV